VTQAKEDDTLDTLCTRVDMALYKAKKAVRTELSLYSAKEI
jgi:PleD family two-component response regulator